MAESTAVFDDAIAYERFMGQWSRAAGSEFLAWMAPQKDVAWLEIGCGTGAFTEMVVQNCLPKSVVAIDPSPEQVEFARSRSSIETVDFHVADAQAIPFDDSSFEIVVSALVLNFVPDRPRALCEMRRVGRPGAVVAAYVWDFAGRRTPNALGAIARQFGLEVPPVPGTEDSPRDALDSLFARAGLRDIATTSIDIEISFPNLKEFWSAQTPSFSPLTKLISTLPEVKRSEFLDLVRDALPVRPDGSIAYPARAHAVRGYVP
jgi:ubiquinone/menaquinone biosynthesis C-methylase UbiE